MPYLAPWESLQSLYGSKDMALYNTVLEKQQFRIAELKTSFDEEPTGYLLDIINGANQHKNGALYGYAFELICLTIGRLMNNSQWYPTPHMWDIETALTDNLPFSVPAPDDFPAYWVISPENMDKVCHKIETAATISDPEREQFLHWLKRGKETNRALVLFYY